MTCHSQRQSIWETHQSISSAARVWSPSFTAAISRCSAVLLLQSPFNMTQSSQPTISAGQGYPSDGPSGEGYDLQQSGYGGSQMFPPPQFQGQGRSSPGAQRVPLGPPENHAVNQTTSSSSTSVPQPPSRAPGRHPISHLLN